MSRYEIYELLKEDIKKTAKSEKEYSKRVKSLAKKLKI